MSAVPYLEDADFTLYNGDALEVLRELPAESVQMCVTSPPYWGLRDYGTGSWEGGDAECDHRIDPRALTVGREGNPHGTPPGGNRSRTATFAEVCARCGARRVDNQLGLEPTPELYIERMVEVFREVKRVLRKDGTCWLNIGDSYFANQTGNQPNQERSDTTKSGAAAHLPNAWSGSEQTPVVRPSWLKAKDLAMMPARLALALQADGWYLRSQIVWSKPNPMPESCTDRPTSAYELVYLLAKQPRYFYDANAVSEPAGWERWGDQTIVKDQPGKANWIKPKTKQELVGESRPAGRGDTYSGFNGRYAADDPASRRTRNLRNVWTIATEPFPEAHFATFPQALVERCIKAGSAPGDVVFDPFLGSGTTALVARRLGRRCIGIELSPDYCELAAKRTQQLSLEATA